MRWSSNRSGGVGLLAGLLIGAPVRAQGPDADAPHLDSRLRQFCEQVRGGIEHYPGDARTARVAVNPLRGDATDLPTSRVSRYLTDYLAMRCLEDWGKLLVVRTADGGPDLGDSPEQVQGNARRYDLGLVLFGETRRAIDFYDVRLQVLSPAGDAAPLDLRATLPAGALDARLAVLMPRPWQSAVRSAILPGWGHMARDEWALGIGYAVAEAALLGAAIGLHVRGASARSDYEKGLPETVGARAEAEDAFALRNGFLVAAGVLWAWQVGHAWWGARYDPERALRVSPTATPGGAGLGLRW